MACRQKESRCAAELSKPAPSRAPPDRAKHNPLWRTLALQAGNGRAAMSSFTWSAEPAELEADRVANEVASSTAEVHSAADTMPLSGRPMPKRVRRKLESRLGTQLDSVRIHTNLDAAQLSSDLGARAVTFGDHIAFGAGQYRPDTREGARLIAHEATHVAQQRGSPRVSNRLGPGAVAGDWIIDNPARQVGGIGPTDADLIDAAFQEICPLAGRTGNRITMALGPAQTNRTAGCACLQDIETDLASPTPRLSGTPHVRLGLDDWSFSNAAGSPPMASPRHPHGDFEWGYWTGAQARQTKPFFQTVAHEVCGHIATFVRTGSAGGRASATGHNPAIEEENRIATEHGFTGSQLRGLDVDPTGNPLPGHRGESFLQAMAVDFTHMGSALAASANSVVNQAVDTIATFHNVHSRDLLVQVEGFSLSNEGNAVATARAEAVRLAIQTEITNRGIPRPVSRFSPDLTTIMPGQSAPNTSNANRKVHVYLFHRLHSAGP